MNKRCVLPSFAIAIFAAIAAPAAHASDTCEVGARMSDGTICAGISPDTKQPIYALPADAPLILRWQEAMDYAAALDAHGHTDWKLPTKAELNVLYQNRNKGALKGTFDERGSPSGWYWSSSEHPCNPDDARRELFSDGFQMWIWKFHDASVRPVRSEPRP